MSSSSEEALGEITELILKTATGSELLPEAPRITELIPLVSSHPFEAFVTCHKHLHGRINSLAENTVDDLKVVTGQLKLCFHERNPNAHSCLNKIIVSYFELYVKSTDEIKVSIDLELLPRVFEFVTAFACISQIANLIELFNLKTIDRQELVPFVRQMIEQNCHIHAAMIIHQLDMRHHFDSNRLLLELLHDDNLLDIDAYLQLGTFKLNHTIVSSFLDNCDNSTDHEKTVEIIFLQFLQYLDTVFTNSANPEVIPAFERLNPVPKNQKKQFFRKVSRYVLDLFRRPIFAELPDDTLHLFCPNITTDFYSKQLSSLVYRFKDSMSLNAIMDHINSLTKLTIGPKIIPQAHEHILSLFTKRNDFASASEYIRVYNITSNLFTATFPKEEEKLVKTDTATVVYSIPLTLGNGIVLVETEEQFNKCLEQILKWDFLSLDSEWFNDFFAIRSQTIVSLIQIAHDNICYLIDLVCLSKSKPMHFYLGQLLEKVINNMAILKIGYSIQNDFDIFLRSYCHSLEMDAPDNEDYTSTTANNERISLSPANVLDFREFYLYVNNAKDNYQDLFEKARHSISGQLSGISQVTYALTGFSIDKNEQMSDWSKRPLRNSQVIYAASDAYCLVECYREMGRLFSTKKNISMNSFIEDVYRKQTTSSITSTANAKKKIGKQQGTSDCAEHTVDFDREPMEMNQFKCVVDDMLFGISRYLRICNADTLLVDTKDRDKSVMLALKEGRVFITTGQVYERYRKYFSDPKDCIKLGHSNTSALEQFKELVIRCRLIIRLADLFARCSLCNGAPFIIISPTEFEAHYIQYLKECEAAEEQTTENGTDENVVEVPFIVPANGKRNACRMDFGKFGKMKFIHKMPQVDKFYICPNLQCGHIFWDGCHSSNFINSIRSLIVDA